MPADTVKHTPLDELLRRFEMAAFARAANLPRGREARAAAIRDRDADYDAARQAIADFADQSRRAPDPVREKLVEALEWVRRNYASGSTTEINARIDAAFLLAKGEKA